jgi:hypothetical protein
MARRTPRRQGLFGVWWTPEGPMVPCLRYDEDLGNCGVRLTNMVGEGVWRAPV